MVTIIVGGSMLQGVLAQHCNVIMFGPKCSCLVDRPSSVGLWWSGVSTYCMRMDMSPNPKLWLQKKVKRTWKQDDFGGIMVMKTDRSPACAPALNWQSPLRFYSYGSLPFISHCKVTAGYARLRIKINADLDTRIADLILTNCLTACCCNDWAVAHNG